MVVERFILVAVDICCDDAAELDTHLKTVSPRTKKRQGIFADLLLYSAVETLLEPTLFEFLLAQPTLIA